MSNKLDNLAKIFPDIFAEDGVTLRNSARARLREMQDTKGWEIYTRLLEFYAQRALEDTAEIWTRHYLRAIPSDDAVALQVDATLIQNYDITQKGIHQGYKAALSLLAFLLDSPEETDEHDRPTGQ